MLTGIHGSAPARPRLFFKRTCPPCTWMSRLVVVFSLGLVRRTPIDSDEAAELYRKHPGHEGQLVLLVGRRVTFGRRVFLSVPRIVLTAPIVLTWRALRGPGGAERQGELGT